MTILQEQLSRRTVEFFSFAHRLEQDEEDLYIWDRQGGRKHKSKHLESEPGGWVWCGAAPVLPRPGLPCLCHFISVILGAARSKPSIPALERGWGAAGEEREGPLLPPSPARHRADAVRRFPLPFNNAAALRREAGSSLSSSPAPLHWHPRLDERCHRAAQPGQAEDDSGRAFALWRRALSFCLPF